MATSGTFLDGRGAHGDGARHTYPGGMARSPLTLAASVTSALPRVAVVGVAPLTEGVSGRYDSAIATLDDDRRVVVRVPVNDEAQDDLLAEARALISLTAGVRGVLPFGAPDVLGQTSVDGRAALVQSLLPGYRVDAAHVPSGRGIATALAAAIAAVHDLPVTVIRDAGLPMLTSGQVRDEAERLLDRAEATGLLPFGLLRRWSTALASRFGAVPSPDTLEGFRIDTVARGVAYNSQLTPCWDGMQEVLAPELTFIESSTNVDYQVYRQAARATLDSPEGKAALQKRTTCMENEGVVVDPETSMPSSDYGTGERADETMVRVAVVAAQCSEQTGAIQELYDLTARYQAAYIDQREAQFVALEEHATAVEARLDEVLRDPDAAWASRPAG